MMKMNSNEQRSKKTCQKKSVFYFENSSGFIRKIKKLEKDAKKGHQGTEEVISRFFWKRLRHVALISLLAISKQNCENTRNSVHQS